MGKYDLILSASKAGLAEVNAGVGQAVEALSLNERVGKALRLMIEELSTNVVIHGAADPDTKITFSMMTDEEGHFTVTMMDEGAPFDPRSLHFQAYDEKNVDDWPVGKMGWPIILAYFNLTSYRYTDRRNEMAFSLRPGI